MTIYDIADKAGVSASSVSRVLNNKPGVSEDNRRMITALLEECDFVPNAIAKGLVSKSSKAVGVLISDLRVSHHTDGVYYIEKELSNYGYCSLIINTGSNAADKVRAIRELEYRRVEGVIMMGAVFQCEEVKSAIRRHLKSVPVIMVNGWLDLPNVCGEICDEEQATRDCVERLRALGRKNIAFICDDGENPSVQAKRRGFSAAFQTGGFAPAGIYFTGNSYEGGEKATRRLIKEHPEVDGILYSADILAAAGVHVLADSGYPIPQRVAVIGMNNSIYAKISSPTITSLDNKRYEASVMAAGMIRKRISGIKVERRIMLYSQLVERESTGCGL